MKYLRKILLIDLLIGLSVTLKYLFMKKVTVEYPEEKIHVQPRYRGMIRLYKDENGRDLCVACMQCVRACPDLLISIEGERAPDKKLYPKTFTWNASRCMFCGLCVEACPFDAIRFTGDYELAVYDKKKLYFQKEDLYPETDIKKKLMGEK
ncbi:MAG: NADH-quinone oxidoreductase subunit I [Acidobacteriota bacterium]